jgi:hypothetical protein
MKKASRTLLLVLLCSICAASATVQVIRQRQREMTKPTELFGVIWDQMMAFRNQDYASAYRQASNGFQERFNIEAFTDLVQTDYPPLRAAERVEFGAVRWDGSRHAVIPAYFFMPDREVIPCLYSLVQEDGHWKIDGVRVEKRWRAGSRLGGLRA